MAQQGMHETEEERTGQLMQDELAAGIISHLKAIERGISSLRLIEMLTLFVLVLVSLQGVVRWGARCRRA